MTIIRTLIYFLRIETAPCLSTFAPFLNSPLRTPPYIPKCFLEERGLSQPTPMTIVTKAFQGTTTVE